MLYKRSTLENIVYDLYFQKNKHDSFREHITQTDNVTRLHPIIRTEGVLQSNPVTGCFYEPDGPSEKQSTTLSIKDMLTATVLLGCYVHLTTLDVVKCSQVHSGNDCMTNQ